MPEQSLKNHWIQKKDHGEWNGLEQQRDLQVVEECADVSEGFQGLDFDGNYSGLQYNEPRQSGGLFDYVTDESEDGDEIEFGDEFFGVGYGDADNVIHSLYEGDLETPESRPRRIQEDVETFIGAGIFLNRLIDKRVTSGFLLRGQSSINYHDIRAFR